MSIICINIFNKTTRHNSPCLDVLLDTAVNSFLPSIDGGSNQLGLLNATAVSIVLENTIMPRPDHFLLGSLLLPLHLLLRFLLGESSLGLFSFFLLGGSLVIPFSPLGNVSGLNTSSLPGGVSAVLAFPAGPAGTGRCLVGSSSHM